MNSTILFHDAKLFGMALTALELDATPDYDADSVDLMISSNEIDTIVAILSANDITEFDLEGEADENDEHDQFRHDGEADGDALVSAGFGTDEDYGSFGGNDE